MDACVTLQRVSIPDPLKLPPKPPQHLKDLKKRRCKNCNELFQPVKEHQLFDCENCRKEFHRYGAAYGPLRTGLERAIEKKYVALDKAIQQRLRAVVNLILTDSNRLEALEGLFRAHRHQQYASDDYTDRPQAIVEQEQAAIVERIKAGDVAISKRPKKHTPDCTCIHCTARRLKL